MLDEAGQQEENEDRIPPAPRVPIRSGVYAPAPSQITLLLGGMALATVAIVYAFNWDRERLLHDARNIDRRWDRPDRLADTTLEERRWGRERPDPD